MSTEACAACLRRQPVAVDGVPVLGRGGNPVCAECAAANPLAPLTIGIVGTLAGRPLIEVDGQCPWCPRGERHLHLMKKARATVRTAESQAMKVYHLEME